MENKIEMVEKNCLACGRKFRVMKGSKTKFCSKLCIGEGTGAKRLYFADRKQIRDLIAKVPEVS